MAEEFPVVVHWLVETGMPGQVFLWDKDSCLANTTHRQHMVPEIRSGGPATWTDYSLAMAEDTPIEGTAALLNATSWSHTHIIVTGANVEAAPLLRKWLAKHKIRAHGFVMRQAGDHRPNGQYKVDAVRQLQARGLDVQLFVEDWAEVAEEVTRETGVPCLVVKTEYLADTQAVSGI